MIPILCVCPKIQNTANIWVPETMGGGYRNFFDRDEGFLADFGTLNPRTGHITINSPELLVPNGTT